MSVGSESIFHGKQFIIPLDEVAFIEIGPHEICVVMKGAQHPTDGQGNYLNGYGRSDCPYLSGEEKGAFLRTFQAWCSHRVRRDGVANAVVPIAKVEEKVDREMLMIRHALDTTLPRDLADMSPLYPSAYRQGYGDCLAEMKRILFSLRSEGGAHKG